MSCSKASALEEAFECHSVAVLLDENDGASAGAAATQHALDQLSPDVRERINNDPIVMDSMMQKVREKYLDGFTLAESTALLLKGYTSRSCQKIYQEFQSNP